MKVFACRSTVSVVKIISSQRRIPQLDGVRGIAVSLVVLFHCFGGNDDQSIISNKAIRWFFNRGWSGVDLFFILSGFLIGGILLDHKLDRRFIGVFYYRRFLRIFPLYYLLLLSALLAGGLPEHYWLYLAYLQNMIPAFGLDQDHVAGGIDMIGVTWSLAVEEHFYLLLPFLIAVAPRGRLPAVLISFVVFALTLRAGSFVLGFANAVKFSYFFTFCRFDELMLGTIAAISIRNAVLSDWLGDARTSLYCLMAACVLLLPVITIAEMYTPGWPNSVVGMSVYAVLYLALILLVVCHPTSIAGQFTAAAPLRWLGKRAYSIYLFHLSLIALAGWLLPPVSFVTSACNRAFVLIGIVALAAVLWRLIEEPLILLGHRTAY